MQKNLAITILNAAIDGVAAHHRDDRWILLWLIFPEDSAIVFEIERIDHIWKWRDEIHHIANHQRAALMAAQDARRKRPLWPQILGVLCIDLLDVRIIPVSVV